MRMCLRCAVGSGVIIDGSGAAVDRGRGHGILTVQNKAMHRCSGGRGVFFDGSDAAVRAEDSAKVLVADLAPSD